MSVNRHPQSGDRQAADHPGAIFAGGLAGAVVLAIPAGLLELVAASTGLSELLPTFAPPLGWGVRIVAAIIVAGLAAACVWTLAGGKPMKTKRNFAMGWPSKLGWQHVTRLARGADNAAHDGAFRRPDPRPKMASIGPGNVVGPQELEGLLSRRRADSHPDAPPRPPLFASRDLPVIELTEVTPEPQTTKGDAVVVPLSAALIRDLTAKRPPPLPRSPEPLPDADLAAIAEALGPVCVVHLAQAALSLPDAVVTGTPEAAAAPLRYLVGHFERQVERRIAAVEPEPGELSVVAETPAIERQVLAEPEPVVDAIRPEMDNELQAALAALKRLSEQSRNR